MQALHPYDTKTQSIHVPESIDAELRLLLQSGNKVAAVSKVTKLTGAGLQLFKSYVDALENHLGKR